MKPLNENNALAALLYLLSKQNLTSFEIENLIIKTLQEKELLKKEN